LYYKLSYLLVSDFGISATLDFFHILALKYVSNVSRLIIWVTIPYPPEVTPMSQI